MNPPSWLARMAEVAPNVDPDGMGWPMPSAEVGARQSAVLVAFADGPDGPSVLLIQRAATMRSHAGQVAFPGGASDPEDADAAATAMREANEEVGLEPSTVRVIATLPPVYLLPSNFEVRAVIAWWEKPHPVGVVDPAEVAGVEVVPIAELVDPANRFRVIHPSGFHGPGFEARGLFVWGFTAMLLDRLLEFGGWAVPWDDSVRRPLPDPSLAIPPDTETAGTVPP